MADWIDRLCDEEYLKECNERIRKMLEDKRAAGGKIYSEDEMVDWPDDADSEEVQEYFEQLHNKE